MHVFFSDCVFVYIMSEPARLCTDNLTKTMWSALPLSIYGCGWNVGGFLSKVREDESFSLQEI